MKNQPIDVKPGDEIVIVVPESEGDEIVIDLDDDFSFDDEDEIIEPNEWFFDDDPYKIVYYEFPDFD